MFKIKCLHCDSFNYIKAEDEDSHQAWRCWNCEYIWMFDIYTVKPISIVDGNKEKENGN